MGKNTSGLYDFGVEFLKKNPKLAEIHELFKHAIIRYCKKNNIVVFQNKPDEEIRSAGAVWLLAAVFVFVLGIFNLLKLSLFGFIFHLIIALPLYAIGVVRLAGIKDKSLLWVEQKPNDILVGKETPVQPVRQKEQKDKKKTPFDRAWGLLGSGVLLVWVYLCLAYPETLNTWLREHHVWEYLPHEKDWNMELDGVYYLVFGVIFIPWIFGSLGAILKGILFLFRKLSPKRDIREL